MFADPNTNTTSDKRIALLNELLSDLDTKFRGCNSNTQEHLDYVKSSINELIRALNREKVQQLSFLVQSGCLAEAGEARIKDFPNLELGCLEEIVKLSYGGRKENLENVINFANNVDDEELKSEAFTSIYEDMEFRQHTKENQALLLKKYVSELPDPRMKFATLKSSLQKDEDDIVAELEKEIAKSSFCRSLEIASISSSLINALLPKIINNIFDGTELTVLSLMQLANILNNESSKLIIFNGILKELERTSQLETAAAFHLWTYLNYISLEINDLADKISYFCNQSDSDTNKIRINNLLDYKKTYFRLYLQLVEGGKFKVLNFWHNNNASLGKVLPELVEFCYESGAYSNILHALNNLTNDNDALIGLKTLHRKLIAEQKEKTFSVFELFVELKNRMGNQIDSEGEEIVQELKSMAPKCILDVLWGSNSAECKIINKFFYEALCFEQGVRRVVTCPKKRISDDQIWSISVDPRSHLVSFKSHAFDFGGGLFLHQAAGIDSPSIMSGVGDNYVWRIIPAEDDHFKIFNKNGIYKNHFSILRVSLTYTF